jgi:hypothetical protein
MPANYLIFWTISLTVYQLGIITQLIPANYHNVPTNLMQRCNKIMFIHTKRLYLRIAPFYEGAQNTRVDITILWYTSSFSKICSLSCKQGFRDWLSPQGWNVSHGLLYLFSISLGLSPNFSLKPSCRCTHIMCPCRPSQKTHLQIFDLISESTKPIDHIIFINSPDTHLKDTSKQLLQSK